MKFELDKNYKDICDRIEEIFDTNVKLIEKHEIKTFVTNIRKLKTLETKITNINENILNAWVSEQFDDCRI